jgi:hypothetical protein
MSSIEFLRSTGDGTQQNQADQGWGPKRYFSEVTEKNQLPYFRFAAGRN